MQRIQRTRLGLTIVITWSIGLSACGGRDRDTTPSSGAESSLPSVRESADNSPEENKAIAWHMIRREYPRWNTPAQKQCLADLWFRESRWNHRAVNKRTGACGIPQSYPCNKMKSMGERYGVSFRRNPWPQIAWGLQYVDKRYGSPCTAWKRFQRGGGY